MKSMMTHASHPDLLLTTRGCLLLLCDRVHRPVFAEQRRQVLVGQTFGKSLFDTDSGPVSKHVSSGNGH